MEFDRIHYLLLAHLCTSLMPRVAEGTLQVAAAEADEYGRTAGMVALALQGLEYLVDTHQSSNS